MILINKNDIKEIFEKLHKSTKNNYKNNPIQ